MNFVVYFTASIAYETTVNITNGLLILCFCLQLIRLALSPIPNKLKYLFHSQLNFLPNYIMGGLVIYIYTEASYLDGQSDVWIAYGSIRFVFQVLNYSFFVQKEFMNRQTYIVAQLSVTVWICFLTQGVVEAILQ